jgi:hypothetical protein
MILRPFLFFSTLLICSACSVGLDEYEIRQTGSELSGDEIMQALGVSKSDLHLYKLNYNVPNHEAYHLIYSVDVYDDNEGVITKEIGANYSSLPPIDGSFIVKLPSRNNPSLSINGIQHSSNYLFTGVPSQSMYTRAIIAEKAHVVWGEDLMIGLYLVGTTEVYPMSSIKSNSQDGRIPFSLDEELSKLLKTDYKKILVIKVRFEKGDLKESYLKDRV